MYLFLTYFTTINYLKCNYASRSFPLIEWKDGSAEANKSVSFWLRLITCNNIADVQTRRNVTWAPDGLKTETIITLLKGILLK